jgi:hypothetical protein
MKKSLLTVFSYIMFLAITISFCYIYYSKLKEEYNNLTGRYININSQLIKNDYEFLEIAKFSTVDFDFLVYDNENVESEFRDRFSHENKLVFLFSKSSCQPCIDSTFKRLNERNLEYLILTSFHNAREIKIMSGTYEACTVYYISEEFYRITFPSEPVLFLMNSSLIPQAVYFPKSSNASQISRYFGIVEK